MSKIWFLVALLINIFWNVCEANVIFLLRLKMSAQTVRLDIYNNGELISPINDRKLVGELQIKDRTVSISRKIFHHC